jgi:hypothetical protein
MKVISGKAAIWPSWPKTFDTVFHGEPYVPAANDDEDLLCGVMALLDEIADQAHDRHGIDSLLDPEPGEDLGVHNRYRCDCEEPGFFCSGVPGIVAHLENGRLPAGAKVERCDLCRRYDSDEAALQKLKELGHVPP